jgi:hypothetical protein
MEKKVTFSGKIPVQVVELTMDNTEDQEELNRLMRKPGEPPYQPTPDPWAGLLPQGKSNGKPERDK